MSAEKKAKELLKGILGLALAKRMTTKVVKGDYGVTLKLTRTEFSKLLILAEGGIASALEMDAVEVAGQGLTLYDKISEQIKTADEVQSASTEAKSATWKN